MRNQQVIRELDELAISTTRLGYLTAELEANGLDPTDAESIKLILKQVESVQERIRIHLGLSAAVPSAQRQALSPPPRR